MDEGAAVKEEGLEDVEIISVGDDLCLISFSQRVISTWNLLPDSLA